MQVPGHGPRWSLEGGSTGRVIAVKLAADGFDVAVTCAINEAGIRSRTRPGRLTHRLRGGRREPFISTRTVQPRLGC